MTSRTFPVLWTLAASGLAVAALTGFRDTTIAGGIGNSALTRPSGEPGVGQQQFDSDDQAAAALLAAVMAQDSDALQRIFGPSTHEFVTGDKVEDAKAYADQLRSAWRVYSRPRPTTAPADQRW